MTMDGEQDLTIYSEDDAGVHYCTDNHVVNVLYGRNFDLQYSSIQQYFEEEYPGLKVYGRKAIQWDEIFIHIRTFCVLFGLAWLLLGGDRLLRSIIGPKRRLPKLYWTVQDNAIPLLIFWFLLAPRIAMVLSTDNTFDVYIDRTRIFSMSSLSKYPGGLTETIDEGITKILSSC